MHWQHLKRRYQADAIASSAGDVPFAATASAGAILPHPVSFPSKARSTASARIGVGAIPL